MTNDTQYKRQDLEAIRTRIDKCEKLLKHLKDKEDLIFRKMTEHADICVICGGRGKLRGYDGRNDPYYDRCINCDGYGLCAKNLLSGELE